MEAASLAVALDEGKNHVLVARPALNLKAVLLSDVGLVDLYNVASATQGGKRRRALLRGCGGSGTKRFSWCTRASAGFDGSKCPSCSRTSSGSPEATGAAAGARTSKMVPLRTVNGLRHSLHLWRPTRVVLPSILLMRFASAFPQCGQTGPLAKAALDIRESGLFVEKLGGVENGIGHGKSPMAPIRKK